MLLYGKEFNEKYKDTIFVRLTNKNEIHNEFEFTTGLNVDVVPFKPYSNCCSGELYFTDIKFICIYKFKKKYKISIVNNKNVQTFCKNFTIFFS
jgi:hypothetical protein